MPTYDHYVLLTLSFDFSSNSGLSIPVPSKPWPIALIKLMMGPLMVVGDLCNTESGSENSNRLSGIRRKVVMLFHIS